MTIQNNYLSILAKITEKAMACQRNPHEIKLIAVSKGHSWESMQITYKAGCRAFGENRVQEALHKISQAPQDIEWHMIGSLQSNKVEKSIGQFALIHSVDSLPLARLISQKSLEKGLVTPILLEVNASGESTKHGLAVNQWRDVYAEALALPGIRIDGLMTIAPYVDDERIIRRCFAVLRNFKEELGLKHLSMGMSHDYLWAIEEGATMLRIGSAIFGSIRS